MHKTLKLLGIASIIILIGLGALREWSKSKNEKTPYDQFLIASGKRGDYLKAFTILYPLVLKKDPKAMELVSESYQYASGVERDLVKANIWLERSKQLGFHTGVEEFEQYKVFLKKKDYGMASVFLERAAEKGNKEAIDILKNDQLLAQNNLIVDKRWSNYWKNFNYEDLYPFEREIKKSGNYNSPVEQ